jgi:hypothetical protein
MNIALKTLCATRASLLCRFCGGARISRCRQDGGGIGVGSARRTQIALVPGTRVTAFVRAVTAMSG